MNVSDDVFKTKLSEFLAENAGKLEVLSGAASKQLVIAGKAVTTSTAKVNTILGRYRPDVQALFNELGSYKNVGLGEVKGGINILNKPDQYYDVATWWNSYNKPWLDAAIDRADDIYLATIPQKAEDIVNASGKLEGAYAQELDHLATRGYKPTNVTDAEWGNILFWLKKTSYNPNGMLVRSLTMSLKGTFDDIIKLGGRVVEEKGVLKLLNKNGDEVAQIVNNKLLPTKYFDDVTHAGATPIGQPSNGYQVFKKVDDFIVKRMPDRSPYSQMELDAHSLTIQMHMFWKGMVMMLQMKRY